MPSPALRILCVEDDADICEVLTTMLSIHSFEAVCVPEVDTAHALMGKEKFRLYILDGQLPGMSGLTLCQEIRAVDKVTPIIIFSGHGYESDRAAGLRAGANAYILKPELKEIIPTVKRLLEQTQASAF
ncbi:MAG TPA: response regulator [Pyrinomonadaceae bacterium]|jgi:DNA-binding response OmpR family regulator